MTGGLWVLLLAVLGAVLIGMVPVDPQVNVTASVYVAGLGGLLLGYSLGQIGKGKTR